MADDSTGPQRRLCHPSLLLRLRRLERQGQLTFYEQCEVRDAQWQGDAWQVHCSTGAGHDCLTHLPIDRIWLATGSQLNVEHWPLLADVRATYPIEPEFLTSHDSGA